MSHSTNAAGGGERPVRRGGSLASLFLIGLFLPISAVLAQATSMGRPMGDTASFQTCTSGWCGQGSNSDRTVFMDEVARLQVALPQLTLAPVDVHGFGTTGGHGGAPATNGSLPVVLSRADPGPSTTCRLAYDSNGPAGRVAWMDALTDAMVARGTPAAAARQSAAAFMAGRGVGECLDELERRGGRHESGSRGALPGVFVPASSGNSSEADLDSNPVQFGAEETIADAFGFLWCAKVGCAVSLADAVAQIAADGAYGRLFHNPEVPREVAEHLRKASGDIDIPFIWNAARAIQKSSIDYSLQVTEPLEITYSPDVASMMAGGTVAGNRVAKPMVQPKPRSMESTPSFDGGFGVTCSLAKDDKARGCGGAGHP